MGEDSLEQQSSALALAQMLFLAQMRAKKVSQLRNCVLHHEGLYDGRLHFDFLAEDLTLCFFLGAVAIYCFMSQLHHSPCTKYEFARSHFLCTLIIRFQCKGWCDGVRLTLIAFFASIFCRRGHVQGYAMVHIFTFSILLHMVAHVCTAL